MDTLWTVLLNDYFGIGIALRHIYTGVIASFLFLFFFHLCTSLKTSEVKLKYWYLFNCTSMLHYL